MQISFIGLGNMGAPMASNLSQAGHLVRGFDTAAVQVEGVETVQSIDELGACDVAILMLPNGNIVRQVAQELLPQMRSGSVLIDCSTVDVNSAIELAEAAKAREILCFDAPVSGGITGASAGSLTFMVGGPEAALAQVQPLFDVMGHKAVYCGASGAGQAAKICNNMILAVTMIGTCEAFALADKLGLERQRLFDVVSTSSGSSWSTNHYCPAPGVGPSSPADHAYQPGFAAELMRKDLGLSQDAARSVDAATPLGAHALALYQQLLEECGGAGKDFSYFLPVFAQAQRDDFQ